MIVKIPNGSVGINFDIVSYGDYYSHRIYRNWLGRVILKINFSEKGLRSGPEIVSYKFRFDHYEDALYVINQYLNNEN
jgi:hypothetical protein